jgi:hypothetical protein
MIEEEEYFQVIEEYFLQKRANPMLLSPKEWALIREWHEAEIPHEVVLRAIDVGFERKKDQDNHPVSLNYFRRIVKAEHKRYRKSLEGTVPGAVTNQPEVKNVEQFILRLIESLSQSSVLAENAGNSALKDLLLESQSKLQVDVLGQFNPNNPLDFQRVEHQLTTMEKGIEQVLLQTIPNQQMNLLKEDAMRDLKSFQEKVDWPVYQEMINRALIKSIRKLYQIPRLSLFYM